MISLSSGLTGNDHSYNDTLKFAKWIVVQKLACHYHTLDMIAAGLSSFCPRFLLCENSYENEFPILTII